MTNPIARYREYYMLAETIVFSEEYMEQAEDGSYEKEDAAELLILLHQRRNKIEQAMKADCSVCFGTGCPASTLSNENPEACPNCNTANKLPAELQSLAN